MINERQDVVFLLPFICPENPMVVIRLVWRFFMHRRMYSRRRMRYSLGVRLFIVGIFLFSLLFMVLFVYVVRSAYL